MVMTRPPAYHPGNFLMKNMNPTNSGLMDSLLCLFLLCCTAAVLKNLPIMLKIILKNKNCAWSIITIIIQICIKKSLIIADNLERLFY